MKEPENCPRGSFCPEGFLENGEFKLTRTPCPSRTYNDKTNLKAASECAQCPVGKYCLEGSTSTGNNCPDGFFCPPG
jgi:hypothetical protein